MTINKVLFNNRKVYNFLVAFQDEIELQESKFKMFKTVYFRYKMLADFFGDTDEIKKYLKLLDKKDVVKLRNVSKFKKKNEKVKDNYYISEVKPDNAFFTADDFYRPLRDMIINYYPKDIFIFEYNTEKIREIINGTRNIKNEEEKNKISENADENLKPEIIIGKLVAYNDGSIRYGKDIIKMRNQIKDLCRLFIKNPNRLITIDDIKDDIIAANKRNAIAYSTIAKYVSELRNSLKIHFNNDVIFNQKEEGWYFKPPK